jgi:hypothetical protein
LTWVSARLAGLVDEAAEDWVALDRLMGEAGDGLAGPGRAELMAAMGLSVVVRASSARTGCWWALAEDQHPAGDFGPGAEQEPFRIGIRSGVGGGMITASRPALAGPTLAGNQ